MTDNVGVSAHLHHTCYKISFSLFICLDVALFKNVAAACCGTYGTEVRAWPSLPAAGPVGLVGVEGICWGRRFGQRFASMLLKQLAAEESSSSSSSFCGVGKPRIVLIFTEIRRKDVFDGLASGKRSLQDVG
jgi:hypothetical protein